MFSCGVMRSGNAHVQLVKPKRLRARYQAAEAPALSRRQNTPSCARTNRAPTSLVTLEEERATSNSCLHSATSLSVRRWCGQKSCRPGAEGHSRAA